MSRRAIDPEERALWHEAMRDVARHRRKGRLVSIPEAVPLTETTRATPAKARAHGGSKPGPAPDSSPGSTGGLRRNGDNGSSLHAPTPGLDRRNALRLKRGQLPVEARLDLHGLTQEEAHRALAGFVARGQAAGKRVVLIVTGKGSREGTGVLKEAVPRWLNEPAIRARVLAMATAVPRDGGDGALYILLRRAR